MSKCDMPRLIGFKDNTGDPRMGDVIPILADPRKPDPNNFDYPMPKGLRFDDDDEGGEGLADSLLRGFRNWLG